jgi:hypothetical protein
VLAIAADAFPRAALGAAALAAAIALSAAARHHGDRLRPPIVETQLEVPALPADVARPLAFGFRSLLSDLTFLEAIQVLAQRRADVTYASALPLDRRLQRLITYSVDVDPRFAGAYRLAGTALPHETTDRKVNGVLGAAQILRQGVRERPDDWHIPFLLGFLESYYLGDMVEAGRHFAQAARLPDAPGYLALLATRVEAHGGDLVSATQIAQTMVAQAQEEEARRQWEERLLLLREERQIRELEATIARWRELRGSVPRSLGELGAERWLPSLPQEPHGAAYLVDEDGSVHPTIVLRLRIFGDTAMQSGLEVH